MGPDAERFEMEAAEETAARDQTMLEDLRTALRGVKDPDLQVNILDLGLVYGLRVEGGETILDMTLTSPGCPAGPQIAEDAERALRSIPGVENVRVNIVWSPPWTPDRMNSRLRAYMGF